MMPSDSMQCLAHDQAGKRRAVSRFPRPPRVALSSKCCARRKKLFSPTSRSEELSFGSAHVASTMPSASMQCLARDQAGKRRAVSRVPRPPQSALSSQDRARRKKSFVRRLGFKKCPSDPAASASSSFQALPHLHFCLQFTRLTLASPSISPTELFHLTLLHL